VKPGEAEVEVEIDALADLDHVVLREQWHSQYGSEPPTRMSREMMVQAIAYHLQEQAFGGLSRGTRTKLLAGVLQKKRPPARVRKERHIKLGTRFLREWNGRTYEVIAMADGKFAFQGAAYRSLSEIARKITGTRWSGPAFFGLNRNSRKSDAAQ
jgi:hypothetical protein